MLVRESFLCVAWKESHRFFRWDFRLPDITMSQFYILLLIEPKIIKTKKEIYTHLSSLRSSSRFLFTACRTDEGSSKFTTSLFGSITYFVSRSSSFLQTSFTSSSIEFCVDFCTASSEELVLGSSLWYSSSMLLRLKLEKKGKEGNVTI